MMFIDASAIVAMLTDEQNGDHIAGRMQAAKSRLTSPIAVFEATITVARILDLPIGDAKATVESFIEAQGMNIVSITPKAATLAIDAFDTYGIGRHPAALNYSDCIAYACAKAYRKPLLFDSSGFTKTDIQPA
ncbi:type II toxin-antitoxin system VapC family toxin (plasmid) [Allorhizobium sp. Av2]